MRGVLRPLTRAVTYTRWLHLLAGAVIAFVCGAVYPGLDGDTAGHWLLVALVPVPLVLGAAVFPAMRPAEGHQARLLLLPGPHARGGGPEGRSAIVARPSASWRDRGRTALWMVLRLETGLLAAVLSLQLPALSLELLDAGLGRESDAASVLRVPGHHWGFALLAPLPVLALLYAMAGLGALTAGAARRLLGPSAAERVEELEELTERLLERDALARELHDSVGHALTVTVVQAGAARTAGSPEFTDRALTAIEETGREALEDLDRVLRVLRRPGREEAGRRPSLEDSGRLVEAARAAGAEVDLEVTGPVGRVPGPVSREGHRMLQEALTNALRHAGTVPVTVRARVAVGDGRVELDVRNPLAPEGHGPDTGGSGNGLRGVRERAALLGGRADAGRVAGAWRVHVELPLDPP
ncbi:sensor histidine kinase [Streptomyces sp. JJ36]|uniref:sensor histidine kinase n=1 Tax=Streptomyces sp. JJ36 TaxID=2736645 RepID=UPI001F00D4AB|nr:histidine kinase [Streptomyces sp. JJ36]MCF6521598.1 two-component sensor histidine kinase [Streptomyces sp. JJ36]